MQYPDSKDPCCPLPLSTTRSMPIHHHHHHHYQEQQKLSLYSRSVDHQQLVELYQRSISPPRTADDSITPLDVLDKYTDLAFISGA